jgi:hypothetical protein
MAPLPLTHKQPVILLPPFARWGELQAERSGPRLSFGRRTLERRSRLSRVPPHAQCRIRRTRRYGISGWDHSSLTPVAGAAWRASFAGTTEAIYRSTKVDASFPLIEWAHHVTFPSASSLRTRSFMRAICVWVARVSCNKAVCEPSSRMTMAVNTVISSRTLASSVRIRSFWRARKLRSASTTLITRIFGRLASRTHVARTTE